MAKEKQPEKQPEKPVTETTKERIEESISELKKLYDIVRKKRDSSEINYKSYHATAQRIKYSYEELGKALYELSSIAGE